MIEKSACQGCGKCVVKKGTRTSVASRHSGWHGEFTPPCTVAVRGSIFSTPTHSLWAGVNCYLALDASNRTKAAVSIRIIKTLRMAAALRLRLAPCRREENLRATVRKKHTQKHGVLQMLFYAWVLRMRAGTRIAGTLYNCRN